MSVGMDLPERTCTKCGKTKPGQSFMTKAATVCRACTGRKKTIKAMTKGMKPEPPAWQLDGSNENWWLRLKAAGKKGTSR